MKADPDPNECRRCYHDRSWHTPECEECLNEEVDEADECQDFESYYPK